MRVLHVIPSMSPARGGPTENLRVTSRALTALGIEVHIACTDDDGPGARLQPPAGRTAQRDGVILRYFPRQTSFYSFSAPLTLWLWRNLRNYDVVHIHALFNYPALAAGLLAWLRGVPFILRPLGTLAPWGFRTRRPFLKALSYRLIERPLLRRAASVHCTSQMEREECSGFRTVVIPNPVEQTPLETQLPEADRTILFLGRLDPKKGLDLLLPAFARVVAVRPDARLLIVGDGAPAFTLALKNTVRELCLESRVVFTGLLTGAGRREAWRKASVFALPSRTENFGISVVEAMERGLAVVISDQVGIHDEISSRHAGLVVRCEIGELADAILRLLGDTELRQSLGASARVASQALYSPASVARLLANLYADVAGGATTGAEVLAAPESKHV